MGNWVQFTKLGKTEWGHHGENMWEVKGKTYEKWKSLASEEATGDDSLVIIGEVAGMNVEVIDIGSHLK